MIWQEDPSNVTMVARAIRLEDVAAGAKLSLRYRGPIEAPIKAGDRVATLRVSIDGQEPHDVPLAAARDVAKANAWQRLRNGLVGMIR